ncbi:MAG: hypothetical protein HQ526_02220 [Actinobacteria bacterium]|nr:hypothetical protein [Actinomycetota bacterium]
MRFDTKRGIAGLAIVGFALVGCGTNPAPTESASSPAVAKDARYGSVVELKDAAVLAGLPCPKFQISNQVADAAQSATCSDAAVLSTFATDADLQSALARFRSFTDLMTETGADSNSLLVGPNWTINAPEAKALQPVMGGVIDDPQN